MATTTITNLPDATLPLGGDERVPMVQAGVTVDAPASALAALATADLPTLGTAASRDVPATGDASATQVVLGGDSRLSNSREWNAATVTQAQAEAGTSTSRLAFTPQRVFQSAAAWWQANSSAVGRAVATAATQADGRTALGLGSAATAATTDFVAPSTLATYLAAKADLVNGQVPTSQIPAAPVQSVNGQTGVIVLGASDVGALASGALAAPGAIGGTTPAAASFTALSASASLLLPNSAGTAAGHAYRSGDTIKYKDSNNVERLLLNSADNLANLDNTATARTNLGAAALGAIGSSGLTQVAGILGAASPGAPQVYAPLGLAFSGVNLTTLSDVYIPLSDPATALTASTSVAKKTTPYLRTAMVLSDLPIWAVATAPTGASMQFDLKINGTSIYATLPTIAVGSTNSASTPGTFSTAFIAASQTIAVGSAMSYFVTQVGSTVAGAGLEVILPTRRAG